jgi:acetoin utilization deacetylase AcuC-like enzyme
LIARIEMSIALISHPDCLLHEAGYEHPERPDRIRVIEEALLNSSLSSILHSYQAPLASKEQLLLVHDKHYVDRILNLPLTNGFIELDPDTYINRYSVQAALRAAGAAIYAVDLVMSHEVNIAFCNIRPPGHHAERIKQWDFVFLITWLLALPTHCLTIN